MKTLFENKYTCTEEVYLDIYKHLYFSNKVYVGIAIFYSIVFIFANALTLSNGEGINVESLLALIVLYGAMYCFYRHSAKKQYKRDLSVNMQRAMTAIFTVRDDYITVKNGGGSLSKVEYSDIKKVTASRKFIMLVTKEKIALTFKKDSFVKGTAEEFETFLRGKGFKFRSK